MRRKVAFQLSQDEDGYPPFAIEHVWAQATAAPLSYRIDNIPFFASQATFGDIVRVKKRASKLYFDSVISRSPRSLLRVIVYRERRISGIRAQLAKMGCSTEFFGSKPLIAVDVPAKVDLRAVQAWLSDLERAGVITYEEPILRHSE